MRSRLVLFDIDGTLIDTRGAGLHALRRAAEDLHGEGCPDLDLRGATDGGVVRVILTSYGVEVSEAAVARFYERYLACLSEGLGREDFAGVVLPGVPELLEELKAAGATLGLLTGNTAAGAEAKIGRFGLSPYFSFGAFGDDHEDRDRLGPIALERAEELHGRPFAVRETVVVGDTPKDIACGKALGAMTVCVTTGGYGADELRECGADVVVEDFTAAGDVVAAMRDFSGNGH